MIIARQSTARIVTVGPVLDADGVAVTGGVVGDFKIAKNGGAPAALNGSATLTHRHTGFYSLSLTTSDLDTVGQAEIVIDDTTNACPMKEITVIEEAVYDRLFAASGAGYSTHAAADVWSVATRVLTAGTNIALAKGTGVTGFNDLSAAQVNAEVDTALADYDPPTKAELDAADDAVLAAIAALHNLSLADLEGAEIGSIGTAGITDSTLTSAAILAIADALLNRNMSAVSDLGTNSTERRTPLQGFRALRNNQAIVDGTYTCYKEDDTTVSWTAEVTTAEGDPISGVNPT